MMSLQLRVLLLCALYGLVFSIAKVALIYAPPLFITGARMILAGIILLVYQYYFDRKAFVFTKAHIGPIFIVGLTGVYLTNALEFWGLQYMEAGKACFIYSFSPIATALLSYAYFSERITLKKWIGLSIGILGFIPILVAGGAVEDHTQHLGPFSYAEIAILLAAIATSIGWITMRVMVKHHTLTPMMSNGTTMLVGGILSLLHSFISEPWNPTPIRDFSAFLPYFLLLTLISNIICYNLHASLLKTFTASYISFAGLTQPFFAVLFGWILLGEVMHTSFWISAFAVTLGLYLYYREELKQGLLVKDWKKTKKR